MAVSGTPELSKHRPPVKRQHLHLLPLAVAAVLAVTSLFAASPSNDKADYIYLEAAYAFDNERFDDYYYLMRRAAAEAPNDTFILGKIAEIELNVIGGDSADVQRNYQAIKARYLADPTNDFYANMFAALAARMGNIDDVIDVWQTLDSLQPKRNEPALNLAQALLAKYQQTLDTSYYNRALGLYNRVEKGLGPTPELSVNKINAYLLRNDTAAVLNTARELAKAAPADIAAQLLIGNVFEHLSMPDSALECYNRAAEIDPENGAVYLTRAEFFRTRGDSTAYDREVFQALESQELPFDQKFELLTGYVSKLYTDTLQWPRIGEMFALLQEINPGEARLHDYYASYQQAIGNTEAAAEQLSYSLDLDPNDPRRWSDLTLLYFNLNDTVMSEETPRKALAIYPESGTFHFLLASSLITQHRDEEALKALGDIDTLEVDNNVLRSNMYATRGDILSRLKRDEEAMADYKKAIELNSENYMAMNNWAYFCAVRAIDLDTAELYAAIASAAEPDSPTVLDTYAWVLFKKKEYDKAKETIDKVLSLFGMLPGHETQPTDEELEAMGREMSAELFDHAGDIYFWNHEPQQAVKFWKEALKLEPDNELIKKKVKAKTYFFE